MLLIMFIVRKKAYANLRVELRMEHFASVEVGYIIADGIRRMWYVKA